MSIKGKSPEFYEYYPRLFHCYFSGVSDDVVEVLSQAGYSYYLAIIKLDAIIDDQEYHHLFDVLDLQEETIKKISSIYPPQHSFWNYWNKRKQEYIEAISLEKNLWNNFDTENYNQVADKKSAFGKVAIDCLFVLSGSKEDEVYRILLESHKNFSIAFQLYDDVLDFSNDLVKKQFNRAVFDLSKIIDFGHYNHDASILIKLLYIEGVGVKLLDEAMLYLEKAKEGVSFLLEKSLWCDTIDDFKHSITELKHTIQAYLQTVKQRAKLKKTPIEEDYFFGYETLESEVFRKGLTFIKNDFLKNYTHLKHFMYLGNNEGFDNDSDLHYSDTFQRALMNDCLRDVVEYHHIDANYFFEKENQYLLERRNTDDIGGWVYFPTMKELAADIDDLGQIMQQFIRSGRLDLVHDYCNRAIHTAIHERSTPNGGIETWIIPKNNLNPTQTRQDEFNSTKWGKGPDLEVVANFAYALKLFDSEHHDSTLKKALDYIISEQKEQGCWESRWYYGDFYGTYVCLRLLNKFPNQYQDAMQRASDFLMGAQNEDGGFGEESYTILSTAFAVFCMDLLPSTQWDIMKKKAQTYLLKNQLSDGSWVGEDFIKPKVNEPYKSKTLTTAYVLKALL